MKTSTALIILAIASVVSLNGCSVFDSKKEVSTDQNLLAVYEDSNSKQIVAITLQFHSPVACATEINNLKSFSDAVCKADKDGCLKLTNAVCIDSQLGDIK